MLISTHKIDIDMHQTFLHQIFHLFDHIFIHKINLGNKILLLACKLIFIYEQIHS